jgi:hypothetical protein
MRQPLRVVPFFSLLQLNHPERSRQVARWTGPKTVKASFPCAERLAGFIWNERCLQVGEANNDD